jgi:hypothetical protein
MRGAGDDRRVRAGHHADDATVVEGGDPELDRTAHRPCGRLDNIDVGWLGVGDLLGTAVVVTTAAYEEGCQHHESRSHGEA